MCDVVQNRHCKSLLCKSRSFLMSGYNSSKSTSQVPCEAQLKLRSIRSNICWNKHKNLKKLEAEDSQDFTSEDNFNGNPGVNRGMYAVDRYHQDSSSIGKIQNSIFHDDGIEMGKHYEKLIGDDPHNPMLLRNYGHYLLRFKGDLIGAEKCYLPALLLEPDNGQFLAEYAEITWNLYRAKPVTIYFFERAVKSSPDDSFVHAAYARFLLQTEDDEDC